MGVLLSQLIGIVKVGGKREVEVEGWRKFLFSLLSMYPPVSRLVGVYIICGWFTLYVPR